MTYYVLKVIRQELRLYFVRILKAKQQIGD